MYLDGSLKGLPESPTTTAHLAQVPLGTSRPPCMQEFQAGRETTSGTSRASGASTSISTNQSASSQTANSQTANSQTASSQTASSQTASSQTASSQTAGTQTAGTQTAGSQAAGGQSGGNLAVPGSQAGLRPQPGRASAPTAVAAAQPSSTKPKWAALLEPGGASMTQAAAPSPSAPPFPGLGKTQAGNLLASLANQSASPGAAGSPAFGPTSPARVATSAAPSGVARAGGVGAPAGPVAAAPAVPASAIPPRVPVASSASTALPAPAVATSALGTAPAPSARPGTIGPVQAVRDAAPQKGQQPPAAADGAAADAANGRTEDNGDSGPDPSSDDILPSKPRASMRLRPRFQFPQIQLPRLKLPNIKLR